MEHPLEAEKVQLANGNHAWDSLPLVFTFWSSQVPYLLGRYSALVMLVALLVWLSVISYQSLTCCLFHSVISIDSHL